MKTEKILIEKLKPHPQNPKLHTDEQVELIANAIERWGITQPPVVDEENTILVGHGRIEAAKRQGLIEIDVVRVKSISDVEKLALMAADNRIAQETTLDELKLQNIVKSLDEQDFPIAALGFSYDVANITESDQKTLEQTKSTDWQIKQIIILFEAEDFEKVTSRFEAIRAKSPELDSNTAIFIQLLNNYTATNHQNEYANN